MKICPSCEARNPSDARFCNQCGTSLDDVPISPEPNSQRAPAYESDLPVDGERRIVTVLFCDVAGSTALAHDLDPERWAEIMAGAFERFTQPIQRYEGTVGRIMGDAVLAFFGAPIAHEDDPRRAVLAGLGILEGIDAYREDVRQRHGIELHVRVGINTGLAVVGEVGSAQKAEYSAMGDAVNLAARMEQTAAPGTVQISEATYRHVAPVFEVEALGEIEVKGRPAPVRAYRVIRERGGVALERGLPGLEAPLVGRDEEMSRLLASFEDLRRGRGRIVSLIGEAGIGKSRLLAEARREVLALRWHQGRSFSYQMSTPYAPISSLLRDMLDLDSSSDAESAYEHLKSEIAAALPSGADAHAPFIAWVLGIQGQGVERLVGPLEPLELQHRTFEAILAYVGAVAAQTPTVLVLEDLHWADGTSLQLLERLLALTERGMLMVLAAFRPHRNERSWGFHEVAMREYGHRYTTITLQPLDPERSRELVGHLLHVEDLPETVRQTILDKAEGNPFYVEEVIRSLLDAGMIEEREGRWFATDEIASIHVPETLAGVLTARIDRLDPSTKRTLQTASVFGREFAYVALEDVHDELDGLEKEIAALERRELIRLERRIPEEVYLFKHILVQEATYASLLHRRRRELHRRVAECVIKLAPARIQDIARHYLAAGERALALPYAVEAGERALGMYALSDAMTWFETARDILRDHPDPTLTRRIYEGLGKALELGGDAQGAIETYDALLEKGKARDDIAMQVSAMNKQALVFGAHMGRLDTSFELLEKAEALAREHSEIPGLLETSMIRCGACSAMGEFGDALEYLGESVDVASNLGLDEPLAYAKVHLAQTLVFKLDFDEAEHRVAEAIRFCEEVGDLNHLAEARSFAQPMLRLAKGDPAAAIRSLSEAIDAARRIGVRFVEASALTLLAYIQHLEGHLEDARQSYLDAIDAAKTSGPRGGLFIPWLITGYWRASLDVSAEAYQAAHGEFVDVFAPSAEQAGTSSWLDLGEIALKLGEFDRAEGYFTKALQIPNIRWLLERPRAWFGMARVALERGAPDEADDVLKARAYIEENDLLHFEPHLLVLEGETRLARGDAQASLERFEAAAETAARLGFEPLHAEAHEGASRALRSLNRHADAETAARRAREVRKL